MKQIIENFPSKDYRIIIGNQIKLFREDKGLSKDELASLMEISSSTISKIESGKFAITIDYIERLSHLLDFKLSLIKNNIK